MFKDDESGPASIFVVETGTERTREPCGEGEDYTRVMHVEVDPENGCVMRG
jgi:hypothetical protein